MEYFGKLSPYGCSEDRPTLDGTVEIEECVKFHRIVSRKIYKINQELRCMSDADLDKVMKYITNLTDKKTIYDMETEI